MKIFLIYKDRILLSSPSITKSLSNPQTLWCSAPKLSFWILTYKNRLISCPLSFPTTKSGLESNSNMFMTWYILPWSVFLLGQWLPIGSDRYHHNLFVELDLLASFQLESLFLYIHVFQVYFVRLKKSNYFRKNVKSFHNSDIFINLPLHWSTLSHIG